MFRAIFRRAPFYILTLTLASSCVKLPRSVQVIRGDLAKSGVLAGAPVTISISKASHDELEKLPGIGPGLAARIVEHRERYGPFRRVEHLMMVRGISERRFQEIQPFITE